MRQILPFLLFGAALAAPAAGEDSLFISADIGGNFLNYESAYLDTGAAVIVKIRPDMELDIGADIALTTEENDEGDVKAGFIFPVNAGLNFTFPAGTAEYLVGIGLSPVFQNQVDTGGINFFMGPFLKAGMRLKVHPVMQVFGEVKQDLLIGPPQWINTGTTATVGILFRVM